MLIVPKQCHSHDQAVHAQHRSLSVGRGQGLAPMGHENVAGGGPPGGGTRRPAVPPGTEGCVRTGAESSQYSCVGF